MAVLIVLVIFILFNTAFDGRFLTVSNIKVIVSHAIYPAFIAWGLCFVFACGYTDMSVGSVLVLSAFMTAILGNLFGYIGFIAGGLITGMLLILLTYTVFVTTKIPSWIAGICMAMIYEAAATFLVNNH